MKTIRVFDNDYDEIEKIIDKYELSDEAELIEWLLVAINNGDIKLDNIL